MSIPKLLKSVQSKHPDKNILGIRGYPNISAMHAMHMHASFFASTPTVNPSVGNNRPSHLSAYRTEQGTSRRIYVYIDIHVVLYTMFSIVFLHQIHLLRVAVRTRIHYICQDKIHYTSQDPLY